MNEVLISYFESKQSALRGRGLIEATYYRPGRRPRIVALARDLEGSRSPYDVPTQAPFGAILGLVLGVLIGSFGGQAGLVVGLFFGLYAGVFADMSRTLDRRVLLDEIQDGLAPGQAALVSFVRQSTAASIERSLARTDAVTAHRYPRVPIEEDVAREVRDVTAEVTRLSEAQVRGEAGFVDGPSRIAAARRKLSILEAVAVRLLWLEQLQFEFEIAMLNRERREAPWWRGRRFQDRVATVRASHRRSRRLLEASRNRVHAAATLAEGITSL